MQRRGLDRAEMSSRYQLAIAHAVTAAVLFVATLLVRWEFLERSVIDWDESLYILQAREWLAGRWPFVAVWDMHPLGAPALFVTAFYFGGASILTTRLLGVVAVTIAAWCLYATALRLGMGRWTAIAAGLLCSIYTTAVGGLAVNTEILLIALMGSAIYCALGSPGASSAACFWRTVVVGLFCGMAILVKPVILPQCLLVLVITTRELFLQRPLAWRRLLAHAMAFGGCCMVPALAFALVYWRSGDLDAYIDGSLLAPLRYVRTAAPFDVVARRIGSALLQLAPLLLLTLFAGHAALRSRLPIGNMTEPPPSVIIAAWLLAASFSVVAPRMFYDHYFLLLVPPLSVGAAIGLKYLVCGPSRRGRRHAAFAAGVAGIVALGIWAQYVPPWLTGRSAMARVDVPAEVAAVVRHNMTDGNSLFVVNYHPIVYFLANTPLPSPLAFPSDLTSNFSFAALDLDVELNRVLALDNRVVVVDRGHWKDVRPAAQSSIAAMLARDYVLVSTIIDIDGPVEIWRRR